MNNPNIIVNALWGPMIINTNDVNVGREIQRIGVWDKPDIDLISNCCKALLLNKPQIRFYDVGGNIGSHAIPIAKEFGNRIHVRTFEAQRRMFYMLCGNVILNGLNNVVCENVAVSDVDDRMMVFSVPDYNKENNIAGLELTTALNSDNQNMVKLGVDHAKTVTLDSYDESVDFVKLDIEGMEHFALKGMHNILSKSRPICLVEMRKTDKQKVIDIFNSYDYYFQEHTEFDWLFLPRESKLDL